MNVKGTDEIKIQNKSLDDLYEESERLANLFIQNIYKRSYYAHFFKDVQEQGDAIFKDESVF